MNIKKVLIMGLTTIILGTYTVPTSAMEVAKSKIIIKNEITLSASPYLLDDQIMIPVRSFAKSQDYKVVWNGKDKTDTVLKNGEILYKVQANSDIAIVKGKTYKLNNPVEVKDGRVFVEAEFLSLMHNITIEIDNTDMKHYSYQFEKGNSGFKAIFSDYHYDVTGNYDIYEMKSGYKKIPVKNNESMGLYLASHNRSDDVFMGYVKEINGLTPNKEYTFDIEFQLATSTEAGGFGIGGSPSSAVYVKLGASTMKPESILDEKAGTYRMNIDIGNQSQDGTNMQVIGDVGKPVDSLVTGFDYKLMQGTVKAVSDEKGSIYLIVGTDSGFEGFTEYYIDNVAITTIN